MGSATPVAATDGCGSLARTDATPRPGDAHAGPTRWRSWSASARSIRGNARPERSCEMQSSGRWRHSRACPIPRCTMRPGPARGFCRTADHLPEGPPSARRARHRVDACGALAAARQNIRDYAAFVRVRHTTAAERLSGSPLHLWQRASCRWSLTPAQLDRPAASVRDFVSGAHMVARRVQMPGANLRPSWT